MPPVSRCKIARSKMQETSSLPTVNGGLPSDPKDISFNFTHATLAIKNGEPVEKATQRLLSELTRPERLQLLDGDQEFWDGMRDMLCDRYNRVPVVHGCISRLSIPGVRFSDGPRGVVMGSSTAFPVSTARGATWDVSLEERVGQAIGKEARAQGANYFAGVCVNLPRHPAWGRIQETYGEDPLILGEFGHALTSGVQKHIMACVKHYALNSMENARFRVDVEVDEDVLREVYLAHFRRIVEGGVASVMSSYNSVNGEWAGQSKALLTDILRGEWGFDGFVLSDFFFGLRDAPLSLKNGLDIEAPFRQQRAMHLKKALESGDLEWKDVDRACLRILRKQLEFAVTTESSTPEPSVVFCQEHQDLAREVGGRSMVLLKNERVGDAKLLPLDSSKINKIALIGRLANTPNTGDKGSSQVFPPHVVTPYEGLKAAFPGAEIVLEDSDSVEAATRAAREADLVLCIAGYSSGDEGEFIIPSLQADPPLRNTLPSTDTAEAKQTLAIFQGGAGDSTQGAGLEVGAGGDRASLRLRDRDVEIITAISEANPRTIASIITAGAIVLEEWKDKVPALLFSWYSGSAGGHALVDVLLGRIDASGRLPFSVPKDESHLPFLDINASKIRYDRWFGQALLDKLGVEASFPLGFGLSYTTFNLGDLEVDAPAEESFAATVTVTNTGDRTGRHVVQIYGRPGVEDFPSRVLLGFSPVDLAAGESRKVSVSASLRPLQRWNDGKYSLPYTEVEVEAAGYSGDPSASRAVVKLA